MKWASAISEHASLGVAIDATASSVRRELAGNPIDLVLVFVSAHHAARFAEVPPLLQGQLPGAVVIGCSGGGVIGAGHEVEHSPAVSITAASLPGVAVRAFHLSEVTTAACDASADEWRARVGVDPGDEPHFVLLPDPFTCDVAGLARALDRAYPDARKVGGVASGGRGRGANALFLDAEMHRTGVVGVALAGDVTVDTLVAQGCRPIGEPAIVTRAQGNVILELGKRRPLDLLRELHDELSDRDKELLRGSLFVGFEMPTARARARVTYKEGELLARNVVGMDPKTGSIAVGASVSEWQVVQFLVRDAAAARDDLTRILERFRAGEGGTRTADGALLFSCVGRGEHLFGRADHDTELFRSHLGAIPLGGFFCNGEIGPVAGSTFLHGYTSAFGLFRPRRPVT